MLLLRRSLAAPAARAASSFCRQRPSAPISSALVSSASRSKESFSSSDRSKSKFLRSSSSSSPLLSLSTSPCRRGTMASSASPSFSTYLSASDAASLDRDLMDPNGVAFSLDQLMELAGLAVAQAVAAAFPCSSHPRVLVVCGPGNNGGDGLVAARHLAQFGYEVEVCYPVRSNREPQYSRLVKQLESCAVPVTSDAGALPRPLFPAFDLAVDAVFGFSFSSDKKPRPPFDSLLEAMTKEKGAPPVVSVDVPSGWGVDDGPLPSGSSPSPSPSISPAALVSLTAPKPGAAKHLPKGCRHFVGGRFVPPALARKYNLELPNYKGSKQVVEVENKPTSSFSSSSPSSSSAAAAASVEELDVAGMRLDYGSPEPLKSDSHAGDPMVEFDAWFRAAASSLALSSTSTSTSSSSSTPPPPSPPEPNAMCLATATEDGNPSARMVLMKGYDEHGITFYTHFASRKGIELETGLKRAALVFHWPHLVRSVRLEGHVSRVPDAEADAYFASRPRGSQVGAHASEQSRVLRGGAEELAASAAAAAARFADESKPVPRPRGWGGFRFSPDRVEFWTGRSSRLHDRVLYTKKTKEEGGGWKVERLAP